jgi:hypothetical protein
MSFSAQQYSFYPVLTPARLVSQINIAGSYFNGQINNGVGATLTPSSSLTAIDSVTLNVNDRVLLQNQTSKNQNGLYIVNAVGTNALLTRASDFQNIEQLKEGQFVVIGAGNVLAGSLWVLVEPLPIQFGISDINFVL